MHTSIHQNTGQCDGTQLRSALAAETRRAEHALQHLTGEDPHRAVHEARKSLKDNRALLRLAKQGSGGKVFRKEEKLIRDLGRSLADARDADVRVALLESRESGNGLREAVLDRMRHNRDAAYEALAREQAFAVLAETLAAVRERQAELPVEEIGEAELLRGLRQTYAACRKELDGLKPGSKMKHYHELRKHVKHLRRQLLFFEGSEQTPAYEALSEISTLLGQDHDEVGLMQLLGAEKKKSARKLAKRLRAEHKATIKDNRKWLLGQARVFFAAKPKRFTKNVRAAVQVDEAVKVGVS